MIVQGTPHEVLVNCKSDCHTQEAQRRHLLSPSQFGQLPNVWWRPLVVVCEICNEHPLVADLGSWEIGWCPSLTAIVHHS